MDNIISNIEIYYFDICWWPLMVRSGNITELKSFLRADITKFQFNKNAKTTNKNHNLKKLILFKHFCK